MKLFFWITVLSISSGTVLYLIFNLIGLKNRILQNITKKNINNFLNFISKKLTVFFFLILTLIACSRHNELKHLDKIINKNQKLVNKVIKIKTDKNIIYKNNDLYLLNYQFCSYNSRSFIYDKNADGKIDKLIFTRNLDPKNLKNLYKKIKLTKKEVESEFQKNIRQPYIYYFLDNTNKTMLVYNFQYHEKEVSAPKFYAWMQYLYKIPLKKAIKSDKKIKEDDNK